MTDGPYIKDDGWSLDCVQVQPGPGTSPEVWTLIVQMDEDREDKQSQIMRSPDWNTTDSAEVFRSQGWISSLWVSPAGTVWAAEGARLWRGTAAGGFVSEPAPAAGQVLRVWGLDDARRFLLGPDGLALQSDGDAWRDISLADGRRLVMIDGSDKAGIHAVGHGGAFCRLGPAGWEPIDLGLDVNLRALHVASDGWIWACGERGVAFRYRDGEVIFLEAELDRYFGGVAPLGGRMFWAAGGYGVEVLEADAIIPFKPDVPGQRIAANDRYLWSCGGNEICRFDGEGWQGEGFA